MFYVPLRGISVKQRQPRCENSVGIEPSSRRYEVDMCATQMQICDAYYRCTTPDREAYDTYT
jgi:hypothetical protein